MKVIVAGSRTITDYKLVERAILESGWHEQITEVVCGSARGVDGIGARWARAYSIQVRYFRADWDIYGKAAGPIRNKEMAQYADALILVWDGQSKGSADMLRKAKAHGLRIYEKVIK